MDKLLNSIPGDIRPLVMPPRLVLVLRPRLPVALVLHPRGIFLS